MRHIEELSQRLLRIRLDSDSERSVRLILEELAKDGPIHLIEEMVRTVIAVYKRDYGTGG